MMMSVLRFNGAAPVRTRIAIWCSPITVPSPCFNGAAPVRTRIVDDLALNGKAAVSLQWGRACEDADRASSC